MEGKVAEIIDQYTIAINIGQDQGVLKGMRFQVIKPNIKITDPQTTETLGEYDYIKATVEIVNVYEKFSIAKSYDTITTSILPFPAFAKKQVKKIPADYYAVERNIQIGDYVRLLVGKKIVTYVKCDNCGKEFKSPIQIKNLSKTIIKDNQGICPNCNQETLIENRNMVNKNSGNESLT